MNRNVGRWAGIILLTALTGCAPVYYGPNTQNVPLLSEKGEYNVAVTGSHQLLEFQVSGSPANNLGMQLNGSWYIPERDSGNYGAGYYTDAGIGFYKAFGPKNILVFETYAIGGIGGVRNTFESYTPGNTYGTIYSNLTRYGVQPVFGVKWKYLDGAVSARFAGLSYFNTSGNLVYRSENQLEYLARNRHSFLIEPAVTLRAGIDVIKVQLQFTGSYNVSNPDFHQRGASVTIGLVASPNRGRQK